MAEPLARESIVGVIGAGTMGAGIAEVAAAAGHPVRLHDSRPGAAAEACDALAARLDKRVARGKLVQAERDALVARITPADALEALAPAALVVEAIVEDLAIKRELFATLEGLVAAGFTTYVPEGTYFATVDIRPVDPAGDGMAFCRALPARCGVVAVPNQVFYAHPEHGRHLVRFACCKRLDVIDEAARRLAQGFVR